MRPKVQFFVLILAALPATAADITRFRGPGGSGVGETTGLPVRWSATENVVWRTKLPGPGTSSPIVIGKRIYLTSYSGYALDDGKGDMNKLMRHVQCIERSDGSVVWTKDFKPALPESRYSPGNDGQHGYASSTIASDGKHLYVFFGKSGIYCLDMDGKEIWHAKVGDGTHGWGSSNSPVLYKDLVIINASIESNSLVALNKQTGKEEWRVKNISSSWNTPVLVDAAGGTELVLNESNAVLAYDPATGKELWRVTGFGGYVCPSVVAHKDIVYVVRGEALAIKAGGRGDVTRSHVQWRTRISSLVPSPVYHEGRLYCAAGPMYCLDATTGKELYRNRLDDFYASALLADGKIFCASRFNGTYVLETGPKFKQLAHNKFADDNSRTNACPIAHEGCVLMRTDRYLYCLGEKR